jgi:hypothetical protein
LTSSDTHPIDANGTHLTASLPNVADLLTDRRQDLLASENTPQNNSEVAASLAVEHIQTPFLQIDHTLLTDDKQNTPLI